MESWLAQHLIEIFLGAIATGASGWVGLNRRRERQLKECRAKCKKLGEDLKRAQRDYGQSLEFNLQDRWTIYELAKMVRDYRRELKLAEGDILLELHEKAKAESRARQLTAGIHVTSSHQIEESYSNE